MADELKSVLIAGDVIVDHHIYMGDRDAHDSASQMGSSDRVSLGGAGLVYALLSNASSHRRRLAEKQRGELEREISLLAKRVFGTSEPPEPAALERDQLIVDLRKRLERQTVPGEEFAVEFGLAVDAQRMPAYLHGYAIWKPFPSGADDGKRVWRVDLPLGYGHRAKTRPEFPRGFQQQAERAPNILVLDDAGLGFRFKLDPADSAWPACLLEDDQSQPDWVVMKMSAPLCHGDLWETVRERYRDRLILIGSVEDVRREEARISRGLSWERTALELLDELNENRMLYDIKQGRHAIVSFGAEGALHFDNDPKGQVFRLIFDSRFTEGMMARRYQGAVFGYTSCLVGGVVTRLALAGQDPPEIELGIRSGLSAMEVMLRHGHGETTLDEPDYQWDTICQELLNPTEGFNRVTLPDPQSGRSLSRSSWTIMGANLQSSVTEPQPLYGIAKGVALSGEKALRHVPHARFGKLYTVDRDEIESLNNVRGLVKHYIDHDKGKKPLSIGVFGPPGSGKSFAIREIAEDLAGGNGEFLKFNLSQFDDPDDLIGGFHQVRDAALTGATPYVFWDEFDSKEYLWLQYLLAPMQDGAFQDDQITHPIGKCIFIFAGGTSYTMENFGPPTRDDIAQEDWEYLTEHQSDRLRTMAAALDKFKLRKGPDFKSRLNGYLNVLGPNRRQRYSLRDDRWEDDPSDICFPVRRALFLRVQLKHFKSQHLKIDRGVLSAFLEADRYKHGARSLEKIVGHMGKPRPSGHTRSDLPSRENMSLHVDADMFLEIVNRDRAFKAEIDKLAPAIHEFWRDFGKKKGWPSNPDLEKPFEELTPEYQADNCAAAARIPHVLELVGLYVVGESDPDTVSNEVYQQILKTHLEILAEAEHDGWMESKRLNGWIFGQTRDDARKIHNAMIPYADLTEKDKAKDRQSVTKYPDVLARAGYKIGSHPAKGR